MADAPCSICPRTKDEHDSPDVHHEYNTEGRLIQKSIKPPPRPSVQRQAVVPIESGVALRLVTRLKEKGLIDDLDYLYVIVGEGNAGSDAESTDGRTLMGDRIDRSTSAPG
jgi:hypothetical protein